MTSNRKKPGVAFWATVVVVVGLVAYPLSYGPICGFAHRMKSPMFISGAGVFYSPVEGVARQTEPTRRILAWWFHLWLPTELPVMSPTAHDSPR